MNYEEIPILRLHQWSSEACLKYINSLGKQWRERERNGI